MKKLTKVFVLILCTLGCIYAQSPKSINRSCSVVCLSSNWIPESYEKNAKCSIDFNSKGTISVHETGDISDRKNLKAEEFIEFKIAIYKQSFESLISFSDKTYSRIEAQRVLEKCEKGDQIIIILKDANRFSLPHYKIDVI